MRSDGGGSRDEAAPPDAIIGTIEGAADRRLLEALPAERLMLEGLAQKVLHGWLQNRHQTLVPLNVNLARFDAPARNAVARFAALAVGASPEASPQAMRAWLATVGADAAALGAYDAERKAGTRLAAALAELEQADLAMIAFVVALVAARGSGPTGDAFASYVAARLSLPSTGMRSARRRYGA